MEIKAALEEAVSLLKKANIDTCRIDAYLLLSHTLKCDMSFIYAHPEHILTDTETGKFFSLINRRVRHEPTAYILGVKEFYGLNFKVNKNVLIPRADTEILIDSAIDDINERENKNIHVLDMCCGSGCIGISIKKNIPQINLTLSDVSAQALEVCKENAADLIGDDNVKIIKSDMFSRYKDEKFDIILSNPPYISENEYEGLAEDIINYEPVSALKADNKGLYFYDVLARESSAYLNFGGRLYLEIGCNQAKEVEKILSDNGYENIKVIKDLAGLNRAITAEFNQEKK